MTSYLTISEREDLYQLKLARKDFKDRIKELEEGRCVLEAEVAALKKPSGGISKETVEQVLGGPIPKDETEAATLHELAKALRESPHPTPEPLFEGTSSKYWVSTLAHDQVLAKLARVTEERDREKALREGWEDQHDRIEKQRDTAVAKRAKIEDGWHRALLCLTSSSPSEALRLMAEEFKKATGKDHGLAPSPLTPEGRINREPTSRTA